MNLTDSFVIDGVRKTSDGYLAAFARVARTGIQEYKGSELGRPDLGVVRVYRPPEEVFSTDALRSFAHRPLTLRHPSTPVTAKNWKRHAGGHTGDEVVRDGDYVKVPLVMMDQAMIDAYERDGIKELSMGYSTDIQWRTGVTDAGEAYDAVQTAIRGNHLAVVPVARGGDKLRIGDDKDEHGYGSYKRGMGPMGEKNAQGHYVVPGGQGHSDSHADHQLNRTILNNGYTYSHSTPIHQANGDVVAHHTYERGEHRVSVKEGNPSDWQTTTSTASGRKVSGQGQASLEKHLKSKSSRYPELRDAMSTKECPECGANVPSDAKSCPECGYEFDDNDTTYDSIQTGDYPMQLVLDGIPVNVADDQSGSIIKKHIASLTSQLSAVTDDFEAFKKKKKEDDQEMTDAKKACDAKDGEIAVLKKQVADSAVTPEKLDVMVKERSAVIDAAKILVGDKYVFDGKTLDAIRKDAVTTKLGDAVNTMPVDAISGAFIALTKDAKPATAASQIGDAIRNRPHTVSNNVSDARQTAYDEMIKRNTDAWKTPAAH